MKYAFGFAAAVGIVSCSMPAPTAPPAPAPRCMALPEPPANPTRAYTLLLINMYAVCAARP